MADAAGAPGTPPFDDRPVRTMAVSCADWAVVATGRPPEAPVAVLHANRVVAAGPAARAEGVVPGLRRREAQARCPSLELHDRDENREARAFEAVLAALEDLAPRLEVIEPGRCLVPTRGPSRYHGGDRALAGKALEAVRTSTAGDVRVGVAVADGPRAALLAADEAVDAAPVVVAPGATAGFLAKLPITRLGHLGREAAETAELLGRLGLRTFGRFAALPAPDVLARFGSSGADLHRLASGREQRPPAVATPPVELRVSTAFEPPVDQVDRAAFAAKALADELHVALGSQGLACTRVLVVAETESGDRIERLWRADGALSAAAIGQRVRWQLEGWLTSGRSRSRSSGGISRLELVPDEVRPDDGVQLGFWGGTSDAQERAMRALARVQALVGSEKVLVAEWRGGRAPIEQYRLVPLDAVDPASRALPAGEPWPGALPSPSPAVLWRHPRPAEVLDAAGRRVGVSGRGQISAPPESVLLGAGAGGGGGRDGVARRVRAWAGPWCVDERWWDAVGHRRRARLQVLLEEADAGGAAHLLALEDGRWWLEATYD